MNRQLELDINRPAWHEVDFGASERLNYDKTAEAKDDARNTVLDDPKSPKRSFSSMQPRITLSTLDKES